MKKEDIKEKVEKAGFNLSELADKMDITPQNLQSRLKSNDYKLSFLKEIANSINKNVYYLINENDNEKSCSEEPNSLYKIKSVAEKDIVNTEISRLNELLELKTELINALKKSVESGEKELKRKQIQIDVLNNFLKQKE